MAASVHSGLPDGGSSASCFANVCRALETFMTLNTDYRLQDTWFQPEIQKLQNDGSLKDEHSA